MAMTADIAASSCKDVGLRIDSHDLEYVFWWLLEAPQNRIHIETIYPLPELQRYKDPEFEPCAAICTICTDEASIYDLPLYHDYGSVKLYLTPSLVPLPQE